MELRKFESLVQETDLDDVGMSGLTFPVTSLKKGKIYTQADQENYDERGRSSKPFLVDDNGCSRDISHMLKNNLVKEIMNYTIFAIDFDGTCVTHEYPKIGKDIGAVPVLKALVNKGHKLVLNTMRSGDGLQDAVNWFSTNNIPLWGINKNPTQKEWTTSPKVYAHVYIDDAALGCPITYTLDGKTQEGRPFVDWGEVKSYLEHYKYL